MKKLGRHTKFWLISCIIILLVILYYSSGYFMIFNNDAYVDADWVKVNATVSGPIAKVHANDNQEVKKGTVLLSLLAAPFEIKVNKAKATLAQAIASKNLLDEEIKEADASLAIFQAKLKLASDDYQRFSKLVKTGAVSKELFDNKREAYHVAKEDILKAQQTLIQTKKQHAIDAANIEAAKSMLNLAKYDLKQSVIKAPAEGIINNLRVYKGDYATAGKPLFGFIKSKTWRVVANVKEGNLVGIKPGKKVWLYLSSHPWKLFRGVIESIGRGVARNPNEQNQAMPYIQPVTNWIRYDYRLPVRIRFIDLNKVKESLYVGSDVKVFIF